MLVRCGADGRAGSGRVGGVRSRDYQIFWDGYWVDLLSYGALLSRASRAWGFAIRSSSCETFLIFLEMSLARNFVRSKVHSPDLEVCCDWSAFFTAQFSRPL